MRRHAGQGSVAPALLMGLVILTVLLAACRGATPSAEAATDTYPMKRLVVVNDTVTHVEVKDFQSAVSASKIPVFVDFWATWCPPCKLSGPFVDTLAKEYNGRVLFIKVDVDQAAALASSFGVKSIPQFFMLVDGKVVDSITGYGATMDDSFRKRIDALLS